MIVFSLNHSLLTKKHSDTLPLLAYPILLYLSNYAENMGNYGVRNKTKYFQFFKIQNQILINPCYISLIRLKFKSAYLGKGPIVDLADYRLY